ncbi:MAG: DUF3429 domain-containing protein [Hyphomonas sp.]
MRLFGIPSLPLALTLSGLIPFAAPAAVLWLAPENAALQDRAGLGLLAYGAVILSFLGGVRWGAEINAQGSGGIPRAALLNLSMLGPLAGWGLVLWGAFAGLAWPLFAAMAGAHGLHAVWDADGAGLPLWYRRLRRLAAGGAIAALAAAAAAYAVR